MVSTETHELRSLTGFRFIAAFYVFVFHTHIRWPLMGPGPLSNVVGQGAVGMTMFFTLSGFILAYRYSQNEFNSRKYLWNRVARIYPIYFVAAVSALPWLIVQMAATSSKFGAVGLLAQYFVLITTGVLMLQAWIPMLFSYWNNNASWSLSVEAFFYILFIPLIRALRHCDWRVLSCLFVAVYLVSLVPILAYCVFDNRPTHAIQIFYAMPIFRLGEFVIGMSVFLLWRQAPALAQRAAWPALFLCLASLVYLGVVGATLPLFISHNWVIIPAVAAAILALAGGGGVIGRALASAPSVWLGKISYCFYSFQFHALGITAYVGNHYVLNSVERFLFALVLLLLLSAVGYHFIEEPARRWLLKRYHERQAHVPLGATAP